MKGKNYYKPLERTNAMIGMGYVTKNEMKIIKNAGSISLVTQDYE